THVFFNKSEAITYINNLNEFPLMGKTNIGASGNGVRKLNNASETINYITQAFDEGIKSKSGPKIKKGSPIKKILKALKNRNFLKQRLKDYRTNLNNIQF